jgi:isopentenyldiphosphate isomerase
MLEKRLWQRYDEQGRPIANGGASKTEVVIKGLLHGAAHVWIWRQRGDGTEVLVQKRASTKLNWPGKFDKSAGGHLYCGEKPLAAALRRCREEIGVELEAKQLQLLGVYRWRAMLNVENLMENEFQWVYLAELAGEPVIRPHFTEVKSTVWRDLATFRDEACADHTPQTFVPYGQPYFSDLCLGLEAATARRRAVIPG